MNMRNLRKKRLIECTFCHSNKFKILLCLHKYLILFLTKKKDLAEKEVNSVKKELIKIREFVEKNFEFVGDKFAKKVRDVYYDKVKKRIFVRYHY